MGRKIKTPFYLEDLWAFAKKLGVILLLLSFIRVLSLLINRAYYYGISSSALIKALLYAVRVDIAVLLLLNGILLLFIAFFPRLASARYRICRFVFVAVNGLLLFACICDAIFFEYTQTRISYDMLFLIPQSITPGLLWVYLRSHWYWVVVLVFIIIVFVRAIKWRPAIMPATDKLTCKIIVVRGLTVLLLSFMIIRGFEARPLSPSTALMYFPARLTSLIPNTGFNLLYSFYHGEKRLKNKSYFTATELDRRFTIYHELIQKDTLNKPNVILFVMESFARDYLDSGSAFKALTPFLDSLMRESLVFKNAFNNGNHSTHGLVSILASLPPFMQTPYYHSPYYAAPIRGIGHILKERGYDCNFFLGDVDDSFGFKEFTRSIGISNYYGMREFGNDKLHNGAWGIHDHHFFSFAADVLKKKHRPFFATIYNVSSHPPFIIPDEYGHRFTIPGQNVAQNSISYVDFAYRLFFDKVKNEPWFQNTVFVFISDHFYSPSVKRKTTTVNNNEIPFFIFSPGRPQLKGARMQVVQQLDVLPTILQLTGYSGRYMSFGKSVLEPNSHPYAVQRRPYGMQIIDSSYALGQDRENDKIIYFYNYKEDPLLTKNMVNDTAYKYDRDQLEDLLKAINQRYNYGFEHNKLYY